MYKIILLTLVLLLSGCNSQTSPSVELTKETCDLAGGKWNECGSPCQGTDAEVCIQVCKAQCECNVQYKCPSGYKCVKSSSKSPEEFGVCEK